MAKYGADGGGDVTVPTTDDFFKIQASRSLAKSEIVSKYFDAWANIIGSRVTQVAYVDLFCGPGVYQDGSESTPLLVLKKAASHRTVRNQLVSIFNDADESTARALSRNIDALLDRQNLVCDPDVTWEPVGTGTLHAYAERLGKTPTLLFLDPWGYKDLSVREIERFISSWGSECIFFFNYRRVNAALSNEKLGGPVAALFGQETADGLSRQLKSLTPEKRKALILKTLREALTGTYGKYVSWFRLVGSSPGADYYLVHVTKGFKGYEVMWEIMAKASSSHDANGVPSFEYNPEKQMSLFKPGESLEDLEHSLMGDFDGQTLTVQEVFERHSYGRNYRMRDFQAAIRRLESDGWIRCLPDARDRPGETLAPDTVVTFIPPESGGPGG